MAWDLIGRDEDLRNSLAALDHHGVVALSGAVGVGRSRLLSEVADRVARADRPVFRVVATAATREVPLSPFVGLLPLEPTPDRSLLLSRVLGALRARGGRDGVVLTVDDAHLLDDVSLALLALLGGQPGVSLVLTVCSDRPAPAGLGPVLDDDGTFRLDVAPLGRDDAAALVATALGPCDDALVDDVWRIAQGNPLVVRTLLAGAADRLVTDDAGRWTSPGPLTSRRLRELVRDRLVHLPDAIRPALDLVAVGAPIPYDLLALAVAADDLTALHDADVVETTASGDEVIVRPTHPLYAELYADHAGETRRREACRRLVAAARERPDTIDPLRVALWQRSTGDPDDPGLALAGAWAAIGRHDGAVAEGLLEPVLDRIEGTTGSFALGVARTQMGRCAEAEEVFADTADLATHDAEITDIASARAFNLAFGLGRAADAEEVLSKATDRLGDGILRSRLDAERGVIAALDGDFVLALDASRSVIDNPDAGGAHLASAYVSRTLADTMLGHCDGLGPVVASGLSVAETCRAEVPFAHDQISIMDANARIAAGALTEADEAAERALAAPDASPLVAVPWIGTLVIARTTIGRLDDAATNAAESLAQAEVADPLALRAQAVGLAGVVAGLRGIPVTDGELDRVRADNNEHRVTVWLDRGRAWTRTASGDRDAGATIAADGGRKAIDGQHVTWGAMALHDAVRLGRPDLVADALDDAVASTRGAHLLEAMAHHGRALLERSAVDLDAVAHTFADFGAWLLAAETMAQVATIRDDGGDPSGSARAEAVSLAWEARCQSPSTPALADRAAVLTARSMQIAGDAARGTPSAEIAEQRFISVRTVDNHLGRLYRALDVGGRDELAALLRPYLAPEE